jgi:hypothetical protein
MLPPHGTRAIALAVLVAACDAKLSSVNPGPGGNGSVDAAPPAEIPPPDAGPPPPPRLPDAGPAPDLPPPAPACAGTATKQPAPCSSIGVTVDPDYAARYSCFDLGPVPGVPPQKYGGLTLTLDRCSGTLLIGGEANLATGKLYKVGVTRDGAGHVTGFAGPAQVYADAPYNDGGVTFGPGGVLFISRWPNNELQQTRPGSTAADKVANLAMLGVAYASASVNFVPMNLPGGGAFKLVSWTGGQWYTIALKADALGTYDLLSVKQELTLPGGPEGFVYVAAGSPLFTSHSLLVSEWSANKIATYTMDDSGNPQLPSRRDFITGLQGAEGAYRDPATGDFFFSTWGQAADRVIVVRGFSPIIE